MKKFLALLLSAMLVVSMFAIVASADGANIASGLGVTLENAEIHTDSVSRDTHLLTDGTLAAAWGEENVYGYKAGSDNATVYLTLDAFSEAKTVVDAKITFFVDGDSGIGKPYEPWLEAKIDGSWKRITVFADLAGDLAPGIYTYNLELPEGAEFINVTSTQYRIGAYVYGWNFVTEIELIEGARVEGGIADTAPVLPTENKIDAVSATVISGTGTAANEHRNGSLIDGLIAPYGATDNWYDHGLWYAFKNDETLNATPVDNDGDGTVNYYDAITLIDLGAEYNIEKIIVNHSGATPDGVGPVWGIFASYSTDGENFTADAQYTDTGANAVNDNPDSENGVWTAAYDTYTTTHTPGGAYTARYIKVNTAFMSGAWGFVSEITVYGTPVDNGSDDTTSEDDNTDSEAPVVSDDDTASEAPVVSEDDDTASTPSTSKPSTSSKPSTPATGDASGMMVFAVIALVAIAGSAVVIKTRR